MERSYPFSQEVCVVCCAFLFIALLTGFSPLSSYELSALGQVDQFSASGEVSKMPVSFLELEQFPSLFQVGSENCTYSVDAYQFMIKPFRLFGGELSLAGSFRYIHDIMGGLTDMTRVYD